MTEEVVGRSERARTHAYDRVQELDERIVELARRRREIEAQIIEGRGSGVEQLRIAHANVDRARLAAGAAAERAAVAEESSAAVHDRAAALHENLADAGVGDADEHRRRADEHRRAARHDREVAQQERAEADRRRHPTVSP